MRTLTKNIIYGIGIGLSLVLTIAIYISERDMMAKLVSAGLILMYVLLVLAVMAAVLMALKAARNAPGKGKWALIAFGIVVVLTAIGYFFDNHSIKEVYLEYGVNTTFKSGLVGGTLIATWMVLGIAIALSIYTAFTDFKNRL